MRAMRAEAFSGYKGLKLVNLPRPASFINSAIPTPATPFSRNRLEAMATMRL